MGLVELAKYLLAYRTVPPPIIIKARLSFKGILS